MVVGRDVPARETWARAEGDVGGDADGLVIDSPTCHLIYTRIWTPVTYTLGTHK